MAASHMYPEFRQILVALHDKAARESETYAKSRTDQKSVTQFLYKIDGVPKVAPAPYQ